MENNEIMNVTENAELITSSTVTTKKIGAGEITMIGFAGIGVIASGYGLYKLFKWGIGKIKSKKANKAAQEPQEATEEPKAEESSAE